MGGKWTPTVRVVRTAVSRHAAGASKVARKGAKPDAWSFFDSVKKSRSVGGSDVSRGCKSAHTVQQFVACWESLDPDVFDSILEVLRSESARHIAVVRRVCSSWRYHVDSRTQHLCLWRDVDSALAQVSRTFPYLRTLEVRCARNSEPQHRLLESVCKLQHLKELDLSRCWDCITSGLEQLQMLASLEKLSLNGWSFIAFGSTSVSSSEVAGLPQVSSLVLRHCENVRDMDFTVLNCLTSLTKLVVLQAKDITGQGLQHIALLTTISDLSLTGVEKINSADVGSFQHLPNLRSLRLHRLGISDNWLARMQALSSLTCLSLGGCEGMTCSGLKALASLVDLSHLRLWGQQGLDISFKGISQLKGLPNLRKLELFQCGNIDEDVVKAHFKRDVDIHIISAPEEIVWEHYEKRSLRCLEQKLQSVQEVGAPEVPIPGCFIPHNLMIHAADNGNLSVLELLIKYGADADYGDSTVALMTRLFDCSTPLHFAVYHGNVEMVRTLVNLGARVNAHCTNDYRTPLHFAAVVGDLEMVRILLAAGAEVDGLDDNNRTPLYTAIQWKQKAVMKELIDWGAEFERRDITGHNGLNFACKVGNLDLVECLLSMGMDVNDGCKQGFPTPLHTAAENGRLNIVKYLVQKGGQAYGKTSGGDTPLFLAAKNCHMETVMYFLDEIKMDLDLHDILGWEDAQGKTLLHYSAAHGWKTVVEDLLRKEVQVNKGDNAGFAPLYYADKNGHQDIVRLLSKRGGLARWLNRPPIYKCGRIKDKCGAFAAAIGF